MPVQQVKEPVAKEGTNCICKTSIKIALSSQLRISILKIFSPGLTMVGPYHRCMIMSSTLEVFDSLVCITAPFALSVL